MPPSQASDVWKYFTRSLDKKSAKCNLCNTDFAFCGGTTNLQNHLRNKHPVTENSGPKKQTSMAAFLSMPTKKVTPSETERITQAIADMIVTDYVPLSIVEGEGFRNLLEILAPDFKIPSRNTVRARIVKCYDSEREVLVSELPSVSSAAITTDTWTSNSTESYITVTEHHINDDWELKSNVLITRAMPERHTGENIAERLQDCVSEFSLDGKIETCVHDNACNMEKAGSICEQWSDLGCFGHTLQLCIKQALDLPSVTKVVTRCRKLVGHFKHSTTLTAEMAKRQKLLDHPQHSLIQDVVTRWNTTQDMLERLDEQRRVLTDIMLDPKVTKKTDSALLLKDHEWDVVSELANVLKVFGDVTAYMCTEKDISSSEIYPIVCGLLNSCLKCSEADSSLIVRVKETIAGELVSRYQPSTEEAAQSTAALASLLDPRYKKLPFFSTQQRKAAEEQLESRMDDLPLKRSTRDDDDVCESPNPSKRRKLDFIVFRSTEMTTDDDLKSYLNEKIDLDAQPMAWWKANKQRFPTVAVVAKKVLAVPATSVPSERIFSFAGLLLNKLRNRLSSGIVDSIIFLNKNRVQTSDCAE